MSLTISTYYSRKQGCVFTRDINKAIAISDAMETGTVQVRRHPAPACCQTLCCVSRISLHAQLGGRACGCTVGDLSARFHNLCPLPHSLSSQINAAPARGPDHFPFQGFRDSGIGSQGIRNSLAMMVKTKSTVINLDKPSYASG